MEDVGFDPPKREILETILLRREPEREMAELEDPTRAACVLEVEERIGLVSEELYWKGGEVVVADPWKAKKVQRVQAYSATGLHEDCYEEVLQEEVVRAMMIGVETGL
jgi:hypothetical protein